MRALPLLLGAGALAYAVSRRRRPVAPPEVTGEWVWPVPRWNGRAPVISDGFDSPRPGLPRHGGVDIMFQRQPTDTLVAGTPNGTRHFVMPDGMTALAASDGVVWSADRLPTGFAVVLDHSPRKAATFYAHLEKLLVTAKQPVRAGQPIGIIGASPLDGEHLKHLHFELWLGGPNDRVDPAARMRSWDMLPAVRNGGLVYRPIGAKGEPYPEWVRALDGKAGVYVIRDIESREIVYVGSSAGRLYDTLTRHFQTWRRWKGFWKGQYGEGHDPGLTYPRDQVEVAIRLTTPSDSLDEELRLIRRLNPRDNLLGRVAEEEVPF